MSRVEMMMEMEHPQCHPDPLTRWGPSNEAHVKGAESGIPRVGWACAWGQRPGWGRSRFDVASQADAGASRRQSSRRVFMQGSRSRAGHGGRAGGAGEESACQPWEGAQSLQLAGKEPRVSCCAVPMPPWGLGTSAEGSSTPGGATARDQQLVHIQTGFPLIFH